MKLNKLLLILFIVSALSFSSKTNQYVLAPNQQSLLPEKSEFIEGGLRYTTNGLHGPLPVMLEMGPHAYKLGITPEIIETILEVATWRYSPVELKRKFNISIQGRSIIFPLRWSSYLRNNGTVYKAIKIKGITDHGRKPVMEAFFDPPNAKVRQPKFNYTIKSGRIKIKRAKPKPSGTNYFDLALNEYRTMLQANQAGLPTGLPLGVGRFTNMRFKDRPVGFVVMALTEFPDIRLGDELSERILKIKDKSPNPMDFLFSMISFNNQTKLSLDAAAKALRKLHQTGKVLKNPHFQNFGHSLTGDVYIFDFENVVDARNITKEEFIFWVFRDFKTLFRSTLNQFNSPAHLESLTFQYLGITDKRHFFRQKPKPNEISIEAMIDFIKHFPDLRELDGQLLSDLFQQWRRIEVFKLIEAWAGSVYDQIHRKESRFRFKILTSDPFDSAI